MNDEQKEQARAEYESGWVPPEYYRQDLLDATKREINYRAARDVLVRAAGVGVAFIFGMAFGLFFL